MWKFSEEMKPIYRDPNDSLAKGGKRHKYVLYVTKLPISNQYMCSSKTEKYIQPPKSDDVFSFFFLLQKTISFLIHINF